ncbi:MAG TPA: hypothetical protein VKZ63_09365 [Kofleriaceae bacterium]|nr:hypothetical protein [Kofleriaceae bacterium]
MTRAPARRGTGAALAAAWLVAAALGGAACKKKQIDVVARGEDETGDYGKIELDAAVAELREDPDSPAAYRRLATRIASLQGTFNEGVAAIAERHLAFLALAPLAAQIDRPLPEQMEALALTVWPTAIGVDPEEGESPRAYLERVCAGVLAGECKYVVPEFWPLVVSDLVWDRMKVRARQAYSECRMCSRDPSYERMLEQYDMHETRVSTQRAEVGDRVLREAWPEAGAHGAPWSGPPVLDLVAEPRELDGEPIEEADWAERIAARRRTAGEVLGVHLGPRTEVRHLRAVVREAARAGYRAVALQARERAYPYALREYRIAAGARGARAVADVRDVDSVQILVRALDAAVGRAAGARGPDAAPVLVRLAE